MKFQQVFLVVLLLASAPALVAAGRQSALSAPRMPYEDEGACPFEGCAYGEWQANQAVVVRRARSPRGFVAFTVLKNEKVTAVTGIVVTTSPGRVRFRTPAVLRSLSGPVQVEGGETLYLLTYRGEGLTKAWFKGKIYDDLDGSKAFFNGLCETDPTRCPGDILAGARQTWWVLIRNAKGQTGWTYQPERFDMKDTLALRLPRLLLAGLRHRV
jgi:hypothetical protein